MEGSSVSRLSDKKITYCELGQGPDVRLSTYSGREFVAYLYPEDLEQLKTLLSWNPTVLKKAQRLLKDGTDEGWFAERL
jgi:hypothetical protein